MNLRFPPGQQTALIYVVKIKMYSSRTQSTKSHGCCHRRPKIHIPANCVTHNVLNLYLKHCNSNHNVYI
jgi:hypothetical protein